MHGCRFKHWFNHRNGHGFLHLATRLFTTKTSPTNATTRNYKLGNRVYQFKPLIDIGAGERLRLKLDDGRAIELVAE